MKVPSQYTTDDSSCHNVNFLFILLLRIEFSFHNSYNSLPSLRGVFFFYRARLLTIKLLERDYVATWLKSSQQKFYGRQRELVGCHGIALCSMKIDLFSVS